MSELVAYGHCWNNVMQGKAVLNQAALAVARPGRLGLLSTPLIACDSATDP